jgi:FkbM family methyltransferase
MFCQSLTARSDAIAIQRPKVSIRDIAKRLTALTPFRIVRSAPNRFQSIGFSLRHLSRLGYEPKRIIDGGAHLGWFALEASAIFPTATVHMIDPQPACRAPLEALAAERSFLFHPFALSAAPGIAPMICDDVPATGAQLKGPSTIYSGETVDVEATTLDILFSSISKPSDRTLLKLDLQGHELVALEGASQILEFVEVAIVEVSFIGHRHDVTMPGIMEFFFRNGFDLFDIASLSGRPRDNRLREGDLIFVRYGSPISADADWS